jgi:hypothetical protein
MSSMTQAHKVTQEIKKLVQQRKGLDFNEVRLIVAMERAIARLSADSILSQHLNI